MTEKFRKALQYGYRHFDCSRNYGNEVVVGRAIQVCIQEGRVKREELFVTTKTCNHVDKNPVL